MRINDLNETQQRAVETLEGPVLIIAGAGTGKTRTLAHRISYLIQIGIKPENILAITFTNRAAQEMRERADRILEKHFDTLLITTFHSLGLRILKESSRDDFVIYDRNDQMNLVRVICKESHTKARKIADKISRIKNLIEEQNDDEKSVYETYQGYIGRNNIIDFDDLILKPLTLLQNSAVLERYQNAFRYIMVDEYQDINRAQYMFVRKLAEGRGNICAVGDSDQAIYAFRGADVENFLNFQRDFPSAQLIRLTANYRSTKNILDASNHLIKQNEKRIAKELFSSKEEGEKIPVISVPDENAEGEIIVHEIEERVGGTSHYQHYKGTNNMSAGSYRFSDFAVLMRTNAQSGALEESLVRSGIPYQIIGSNHLLDRREIKDVLAYLKVVINPADTMNIERIINRPSRGIGEMTILALKDYADRKGMTLYEAMKADAGPGGDRKKKVKDFITRIEHFIELKETVPADELLSRIIEETGLKELYQDREDSFLLLENLASAYRDRKPPFSSLYFITDMTLMMPADAYDPIADKVTVMTMHMAKGLEFRTVFITGVEEGMIPFSLREDIDTEEERRLFYVAMTRAKEELFLLHSRRRILYGQTLAPSPSRFIKEIPVQLLEHRCIPDRIKKTKEEPQMGLF